MKNHCHSHYHYSPCRSTLLHIEGQVPLADNNGLLSACFYVMCRQAAPRQSRAMRPQTIEHLRTTLWPAPSQTVRRSQAARRRLRRRALIFRLGARAALVGPPGLAKYGTLVNVITSGEHGLDKTDGITFEEQETDSRTCEGDSTFFYNADVNTNVAGLITDCTGDSGAIAGGPGSAGMGSEEQGTVYLKFEVNTNVIGLITDCTGDFGTTAGVPDSTAIPMDKETFTENVPSDAKSGCEFEGKHEQSMLSVSEGYNLCRDDTDPVVLQRSARKYAVRALRRRCQFRHRHHRTRPVLQSQCRLPLRHHRTSLLRVIRTCRV